VLLNLLLALCRRGGLPNRISQHKTAFAFSAFRAKHAENENVLFNFNLRAPLLPFIMSFRVLCVFAFMCCFLVDGSPVKRDFALSKRTQNLDINLPIDISLEDSLYTKEWAGQTLKRAFVKLFLLCSRAERAFSTFVSKLL
jgi:hypothetical protein